VPSARCVASTATPEDAASGDERLVGRVQAPLERYLTGRGPEVALLRPALGDFSEALVEFVDQVAQTRVSEVARHING